MSLPTSLPSCAPFAPLPLRSFVATMGTADSCAAGSSRHVPMNTFFAAAQVSLLHARHLPDHSVVNHPLSSGACFHTLPLSVTGFRLSSERSGFRHCIAGSAPTAGRNTFVSLGTDRSPPLAPHPASRTDAVTVGYRPESVYLKRTCTSLMARACRRTRPRPCAGEVHACCYHRRQLLEMPRACLVEFHAASYCSRQRETPRRKVVASGRRPRR